ncbi:g10922 [Coccomyxa elongata]
MENSVLDEALDDFAPTNAASPADDQISGKFRVPSAPSGPGSSSPREESSASAAPQNRKGEAKQQTAEASAQPQTSAKHNEVDADLARGVAQLMADLAKAGPSAGDDTGKASPHEREIASTLAALAAAVPVSNRGAEEASSQSSAGQRPEEQMGTGEGDLDGSFASLADSIMQQLLSKDVLYQPMKDIGAKYPAWLAARRNTLPPEELKRYEAQYKYIRQICALYEDDPNNFSQLFALIQEMQACGQPPEEIVQDLAPGLAFGEDGLPQLPASATDKCTIC